MRNAAAVWLAVLAVALSFSAAAQRAPAVEPVRRPVLLSGRPFPHVERYVPAVPYPRRTVPFGSGDLQEALCALGPGDRLVVAKGTYAGGLTVGGGCSNGTSEAPIQVVFESEAVLTAPLVLRRSHWHLSGAHLRLGDATADGVVVAAPRVSLDRVQVSGGTGAGLRVAKGATHVTFSNSVISKRTLTGAPTAAAIEIEAGAGDVLLVNNRLHHNRGGSIAILPPRDASRPAWNVAIRGNTIRGDGATAIAITRATGVQIAGNTLQGLPHAAGARGIELRQADQVTIRSNQISHYALAISAGRIDGTVQPVRELTIDRNHLDTAAAAGTAVAIEAGSGIRFVNNVVNGYADAILLLGRRPSLSGVTIANNLILGVTRTAFVLRDSRSAALFDFNVFSPPRDAVEVEVDGAASPLIRFLAAGAMPHSQIASVRLFDGDLARLGGVVTVDRGTVVADLPFEGKAPDLGVAER